MTNVKQCILKDNETTTVTRGLALLGHYQGVVSKQWHEGLDAAICSFQVADDIYPSGIFCPVSVRAYNRRLAAALRSSARPDALAYTIPWDIKPVRRNAGRMEALRTDGPVCLRADALAAWVKLTAFCDRQGVKLPVLGNGSFLRAGDLDPKATVPYYSLRPAGLSVSLDPARVWKNPRLDMFAVTIDSDHPSGYRVWCRGGDTLTLRALHAVWVESHLNVKGDEYALLVSGSVVGPYFDLTSALDRHGFVASRPSPCFGKGANDLLYGGLHELVFAKGLRRSTVGDAFLRVMSLEEASQHPLWDILENTPLLWMYPWAFTYP